MEKDHPLEETRRRLMSLRRCARFGEDSKEFICAGELREVLTIDDIRAGISAIPILRDQDNERDLRRYASLIWETSLTIFAILLADGNHQHILKFLFRRDTDQRLTFSTDDLYYLPDLVRTHFVERQWRFHPVTLTLDGIHRDINPKAILPFLSHIRSGCGGFGTVWKVQSSIHRHAIYANVYGLADALGRIHNFNFEDDGLEFSRIGYHHDLRPANILVCDGKFVIADFGLSKLKPDDQSSRTILRGGQDDYLGPEHFNYEQWVSGSVGRQLDVWAFGCILAEIATFIERKDVREFREKRMATHRGEHPVTDHAFHLGGKIRPAVSQWLDELIFRPADPQVAQLVAVVRDMLNPNPFKRPKISEITPKLQLLAIDSMFIAVDGLLQEAFSGSDGIPTSNQHVCILLEHKRVLAFRAAFTSLHPAIKLDYSLDMIRDDSKIMGYYAKERVLIEWKEYDISWKDGAEELFSVMDNLTNLLDPEVTPRQGIMDQRILNCLGYFHERRLFRFGFIYSLNGPSRQTQLFSLNNALRVMAVDDAPGPDLGDVFQLAKDLAACLLAVHEVGWLHKSLSSHHVLIFAPDKGSISQHVVSAVLSGFNDSRPEASSFTLGPKQDFEHYRHPKYRTGTPFRSVFDYYGLGIVLLELGSWEPISQLRDRHKDIVGSEEFRLKLLKSYVPQLGEKMGARYRNAVQACLDTEGLMSSMGQNSEDFAAAREFFKLKVVQSLAGCFA
ncbi:hypothetical protein DL768_007414 [Monosporascus sp. mg162]|nr:hypothetical protein DL768_007414 [Monosporascus sp. mg162]